MPLDINGTKITSSTSAYFGYKDTITNGLITSLDASAYESYPGSGTVWYDLSGNGRNGTLNNSPSFTTTGGGALSFNGTNQYVTLGNLGTIGNYQTIEVWFYSTSVTNYKNICDMNYSTYNPNTGNVGPRFEQSSLSSLNSGWEWSSNTTSNSATGGSTTLYTLTANNWYYAVFSNYNGLVGTYLNNVLISSNTGANGFITTFSDVNLGRGFILDTSRYFSGYISIFKIYNRALTAAEINKNWNVQKQKYGL